MNMSFTARNLNEELVDALLDESMSRVDMCRCSRCRADVRAYALNLLPPRYVVTTEGYIYSRMQSLTCQNQADIIAAVSKAVSVVSSQPRHSAV
jgi:competence protein ComFB